MAVQLPTPGEEPWGDELNSAIRGIDVRVSSLELSGGGSGGGTSRFVPVIVFNGESNSGGQARDTSAQPSELAPRPAVQIFDNIGLESFSALDVGTNNMLDHAGIPQNNGSHGWELGLADGFEAGDWWDSTVYLLKTGQGGSIISEWGIEGVYYQKFQMRMRAALKMLRDAGKVPIIYMWYSLGINDSQGGTPEAAWLDAVKSLHASMRAEFGYFPIFMTKFMGAANSYNDSIDEYAAADNMLFAIECDGATLNDSIHWDYAGMKLLASRMAEASREFGQHENYLLKQSANLAGGFSSPPDMDLPTLVLGKTTVVFTEGSPGTITVKLSKQPVANAVVTVSVTGGNVTRSPATLTFTDTTWSTNQTITLSSPDDGTQAGERTATLTLTSTAVALPANVPVLVQDKQAPIPAMAPYTWKDLTNASVDGESAVVCNGTAGGANTVTTVDATKPFTILVDWKSGSETLAAVFFLDDAPSTNFTWAAQVFVSSVYNTGAQTWVGVDGTSQPANALWTPTFPCRIKIEKSGNDIKYSYTTDGVIYTALYTHTGKLSGKTTLYPRVVFASPAANQRLIVSRDMNNEPPSAPANSVKPEITGTTALGDTLTCSSGTWTGTPTGYTYQWRRGGVDISGATTWTHVIVAADQNQSLSCAVTATNATGSTTAVSVDTFIPGAPLTPVTWGTFLNTDSPVAGKIHCTAAAVEVGATAVGTIADVTQPWIIEIEYPSQGEASALVVMLDDSASGGYIWNASQIFTISCHLGGAVPYISTNGGASTAAPISLSTFPCRIKMAKSGNDVTFSLATGAGAYAAPFYTQAGALTGKTGAGYIKAIFAAAAVGQNLIVRTG